MSSAMSAASASLFRLACAAVTIAACSSPITPITSSPITPIPSSPSPTPERPAATASPSPAPSFIPLAVVTRFTDLRVSVEEDELAAAFEAGEVLVPCSLEALELGDAGIAPPWPGECLDPGSIVERVAAESGRLGLLPVDAVSPVVKVLRIGEADLFGSPARRSGPYPLGALGVVPEDAVEYVADEVRTVISLGDTCPDRGVAQQAITLGKGWDWVLDGGTARYTGTHRDTRFSGRDGRGWAVVDAVRVGDHGKVRGIMGDADVTVMFFGCPLIRGFTVGKGATTSFSVDPKTAELFAGAGVDVVTIASNHIFDRGADGLRQTMGFLDVAGIRHVGAGLTLDQALEPAVVEVRGLRFAFAGFDDTVGSPRASADSPGTASLSTKNVTEAARRARAAADVVVALPRWNWPEYYAAFTERALKQRDRLFAAGFDQVLGFGTHWASAMSLTSDANGARVAVSSHGNFVFGQDWSRQTQEGLIYETTFYGTRLVQVRVIPYIVLDQAQPNLTDPETDGAFVQRQVFDASLFELPAGLP